MGLMVHERRNDCEIWYEYLEQAYVRHMSGIFKAYVRDMFGIYRVKKYLAGCFLTPTGRMRTR